MPATKTFTNQVLAFLYLASAWAATTPAELAPRART